MGKIFGIEIHIDSSWLIIFALVTWTLAENYFPTQNPDWSLLLNWFLGFSASIMFFASVLVHELSHSLMAIYQGAKVRNITLFLLGGVAQIADEPDEPFKEFLIAVVGPLSSILIGVIAGSAWFFTREISPHIASIFSYLAIINIVLACFNLLPGFPLDGGRIFRSIIWGLTGNVRLATKIATLSGKVIALLLICWGTWGIFSESNYSGLWRILIGWFLYTTANKSYRHLIVKDTLRKIRVEDLMVTNFDTIPPGLSIQQLVDDYLTPPRDRGFLVINEGTLEGIVSVHDLNKIPRELWTTTTVDRIMIPKEQLEKISPGDDASVALSKLSANNIHQIPVVQENKVCGILRRNDILNYLQLHTTAGTKSA
jgi:Zn-dependent protease